MPLLWLMMACSQPSADQADREVYLATVRDPAQTSRCAEIQSPSLRAECRSLAALALAESGDLDGAQALCVDAPPGPWRDECYFLTCDGARLSATAANRCCADAGQFRLRCRGHALGREAKATFDAFPLGSEAEGLAAVAEVVAREQGAQQWTGKAEQIVASMLAARAPEGPLTPQVCGNIGASMCSDVYEELLRQATSGASGLGFRAACASTVSRERVEMLDLPSWSPELNAVADVTWQRVCHHR